VPELVMVIEDEKAIRDLVRYNLERAGYRVATADDGEAGIERLFDSRPDALVLDLMLPGHSGMEVLRELRDEPTTRELPTTPKADSLPPAPARSDRRTPPPPPPSTVSRPVFPKSEDTVTEKTPPVVTGPRPRASLLATLGLILGVASVLLVLSGPLLGWGIGVAGVALVLSLSGIHATGKRHVAGKSDALLGMVLALGAIVPSPRPVCVRRSSALTRATSSRGLNGLVR